MPQTRIITTPSSESLASAKSRSTGSLFGGSYYGSDSARDPKFLNYNSLNNVIYAGRSDRIERYRTYDAMDKDSDVSRALDMISEYCTSKDPKTKSPLSVSFEDDGDVSPYDTDIIYELIKQWISLNDWRIRIHRLVRNVVKYGDAFFIRDPDTFLLKAVMPHNVVAASVDPETREITHYHFRGLDFSYDFMENDQASLSSEATAATAGGQFRDPLSGHNPEERLRNVRISADHVVHFSLNEGHLSGSGNGQHDDMWPFGESYLEQVYKEYKQRDLLENASVIHRVQRAPSRRVWFIDVGRMRPDKVEGAMRKFRTELLQKRVPNTFGGGETLDTVYNPVSQLEDYFIPMLPDGRGSKVDNLEGSEWDGTGILELFNKKFLRGLRIPTSFMLGPEEGGAQNNDGRAGVAYVEEQMFAGFCEKIQAIIQGSLDYEFKTFVKFRHVQVHSSDYSIGFVSPMNFDEYRESALENERLDRAQSALNIPSISTRFVLKKYAKWDEDDFHENERLWKEENFRSDGISQAQDDIPTGLGGGLGGDFGLGGGPGLEGDIDMGDESEMGAGDTGMGGMQAPSAPGGSPDMGATPPGVESINVDSDFVLMEELSPPIERQDEDPEPLPDDALLATRDGVKRPAMTLKHIRKLRLERERKRSDLLKRLDLVSKMYGENASSESNSPF